MPTDALHSLDPLNENEVVNAAKTAITNLMSKEVVVHTDFIKDHFTSLLNEVKTLTASEEHIAAILKQANDEAKAYAKKYIKRKSEDATKAGKATK